MPAPLPYEERAPRDTVTRTGEDLDMLSTIIPNADEPSAPPTTP